MASTGLVKKLKSGFKRAVLIGTALAVIGSASCKLPTPNNPPEITSSPIVQIHEGEQYMYDVEAIDSDGDILTYSLNQAPDWLSINSATGEITGTAPLVDSDTNYGVEVKVLDGVDSVTQQYELTVEDTSPYAPTVDLSEIPENEKNFDEESQTTINLPIPQDPNPEDNPVPYISAISLDGQVRIISLNENQLTIKGKTDKIDTYQVQLKFGSFEGGIGTATLEGIINNLPDISGVLQDNENDGKDTNGNPLYTSGVIRVYDASNNRLDNIPENIKVYNPTTLTLEGIITDANGNFSFQLNENINFTLQAKLDEPSYVRTRKFLAGDVRDLIIRAVPYPDFEPYSNGEGIPDNVENFKEHVDKTNTRSEFNPEPGLMKWNLDNLLGIEILRYNPLGSGNFMEYQQDFIITKINNPNDIWSYVEKRDINGSRPGWIDIQKDTYYSQNNNGHFKVEDTNNDGIDDTLIPRDGWIVIVPDDSFAGGKTVIWGRYDRIIDKVRINITSGMVENNTTLTHEFAHAFIAPDDYYDTPLSADVTIMKRGSSLLVPGIADKKMAKIVYEDNYQAGEKLDDIMALDFY